MRLYRLRCVHITCQHKSDRHESLGKMMGIRAGAGGGLGHGISATLTRLLALTLLSASSDRIIHTESITLSEGKSASVKKRRPKSERRVRRTLACCLHVRGSPVF